MDRPDVVSHPPGEPHPHPTFRLRAEPELLRLVRLPAGASAPDWLRRVEGFHAVVHDRRATTVLAPARVVPPEVEHVGPLYAFAVEEQADLFACGVLLSLIEPLTRSGLPIKVISSFETDHILVPARHVDRAANVWRATGHQVRVGEDPVPAGVSLTRLLAERPAGTTPR